MDLADIQVRQTAKVVRDALTFKGSCHSLNPFVQ